MKRNTSHQLRDIAGQLQVKTRWTLIGGFDVVGVAVVIGITCSAVAWLVLQ